MSETGWKERLMTLSKLKENLLDLLDRKMIEGPERALQRSVSLTSINSLHPRDGTVSSPKHVKVQRIRTVQRRASMPLKPALRKMGSLSSTDSFDSSASSSPTLRKRVTFSKYALLLAAASENSVQELVNLLDKDPAYINKPSSSGQTPLHKASIKGNKECVELLVSRGADVNFADKQGRTPMLLAWNHKHTECFKIMVEASRKKEQNSKK